MDTDLKLLLHFSADKHVDKYAVLDPADQVMETPVTANLHLLNYAESLFEESVSDCWRELRLSMASGHLELFLEQLAGEDIPFIVPNADPAAFDWGESETIHAADEDGEPSPTDLFIGQEPVSLNLDSVKKVIGYPPVARENEIMGKVVVRLLVDKQGHVTKHVLLKDPHPSLSSAVTSHVYDLRFKPAVADGKTVMCWVTLPFTFMLVR